MGEASLHLNLSQITKYLASPPVTSKNRKSFYISLTKHDSWSPITLTFLKIYAALLFFSTNCSVFRNYLFKKSPFAPIFEKISFRKVYPLQFFYDFFMLLFFNLILPYLIMKSNSSCIFSKVFMIIYWAIRNRFKIYGI